MQQRHVALLRAVNVGGRNRLPMSDLRAIVEGLGHIEVETYIQSGNVMFCADARRATNEQLAAGIHHAIAIATGLDIAVLVRSGAELADVVRANPFADPNLEPSKLMVHFLQAIPSAEAIARLEPDRFAPDRFEVVADHLYAYLPNGQGRSKFTNDYIERRLAVAATARNLNSVLQLLHLVS